MSFFRSVPIVILALTFAAFGISTGEFVVPGLLVEISKDFQIPVNQTGLLITAYALGVVIGGPIVAALTLKFDRKKTLIGLMSVFLIGNLMCALAPSYSVLFVARIITALCPGAFFGLATVVATQLADESAKTQAVALVFIGTTLANMLGVPLGTALGYFFSWRAIFWLVSLISLLSIWGIWKKLPNTLTVEKQVRVLDEFKVFKKPLVLISFLLSALLNGGFFVLYTYITPLLTDVLSVPTKGVSLVLFLLGIALPIGTFVGGKLGDKNTIRSLMGLFGSLILLEVFLFLAIPNTTLGLVLLFFWNTLLFTTTPILQAMSIENAKEAPHLSSTFNQSAFNIGNAVAAAVGSFALHNEMPMSFLPLLSIGFFSIGLLFVLIYRFLKIKESDKSI